MKKEGINLEKQIDNLVQKFNENPDKEIQVISHFDTDGISSATIMIQTLKKLDKKFSLKIVKSLEEQFIYDLPKNKITIFLDLGSGNLNSIVESGLKNVFIIDHHEITQEIPKDINIISSELDKKQKMSASCLTYLFCKKLYPASKELAKLGILGMIGDMLEKEIDKLNNKILEEGEIKRKRGILIYPSTRPLNRTLEYCSNPYIPEVTGNQKGVREFLREIGLKPKNGKYQSLIELNQEEMSKLVTAIMLKNPKTKNNQIIGDIFLINLFNRLEDARELSAMVNACSRLGESGLAIQLLMENPQAKKKAEAMYVRYRQHIVSGLKQIAKIEKIQGKNFLIINAKDSIKDTIIGTLTSILSKSSLYEEGTIITALAYYRDKIKISSRCVGNTDRNVREVLASVVQEIGGEVGGHKQAAGCNISRKNEKEFIDLLKKNLEIELVKI
ncbi:MAG: DHH family phosphoesterase [Nanoarchaeota archaeon]|nr:DHH family phosphoesterase [Nanoarchaeota archaeon]MBU1028221.1 DHH family phosphoesterase [Nanoarchaeota archaeon]